LPWEDARRHLSEIRYFWFATIHAPGHSHVRPEPSGRPPFEMYRIDPSVIFGFGTNDELAPRSACWTF
jgi:hypothetical protein